MTKKISLIGRKKYRYNDDIVINIPTLSQIRGDNDDNENMFWQEVNLFIKTPSDMVSELDSLGLDFEKISDYEMFIMLLINFENSKDYKCQLFDGFNFKDLKADSDKQGHFIFVDKNGKEVFNERVYNDVSDILATMIGTEKTPREKFGNEYAKKKWIERDYRKKSKMKKNGEKNDSFLDSVILRLVCNSNFPYNYETIGDCTIYDTIQGLKQIEKDISVTDLMQSRLVGADLKQVPKEELSRFAI